MQCCDSCNHPVHAHVNGKCPKGLTVTIDADNLEKVVRTGHPRTLKNLVCGTPQDCFKDVTITQLVVIQ